MILHINTTDGDNIEVSVKSGDEIIVNKKIQARYSQAEKLLPAIEGLLKVKKISLNNIKKIKVNNSGGSPVSEHGTSFTALRIGVVTANALGYAMGIPVESEEKDNKVNNKSFSVIKPVYDKEPNITKKKS